MGGCEGAGGDRERALAAEEVRQQTERLHHRLDCLDAGIGKARIECDETDRTFASITSGDASARLS